MSYGYKVSVLRSPWALKTINWILGVHGRISLLVSQLKSEPGFFLNDNLSFSGFLENAYVGKTHVGVLASHS